MADNPLKDILPPDAMTLLSARHGGGRIRIPADIDKPGPLADLIGLDAAERLIEAAGGLRVYVPRGRGGKRLSGARVRQLKRNGMTAAGIARHLHCSERTVFNHL